MSEKSGVLEEGMEGAQVTEEYWENIARQKIRLDIESRWSPVINFVLTQRRTLSRDEALIEHYDAVLRDLESCYQKELDIFQPAEKERKRQK